MSKITDNSDANTNPDNIDMRHGQHQNEERNAGTGVPAAEVATEPNRIHDPRDNYFRPERNTQHPLFSGTDNNQESELRKEENQKKSDALRPLA
jgi:hypothetical protein